MIVYVESNFVLEIALGQEQAAPAERILELAENHRIELAIPAFGLSEPFSRVRQRIRERRRLYEQMANHAQDLGRSQQHQSVVDSLNLLVSSLREVDPLESRRLEETESRLLAVAGVINMSSEIYREAVDYRSKHDLSIEDSVILASVVDDLATRSEPELKCFISRDTAAFSSREIKAILDQFNCRYIAKFADGVRLIEAEGEARDSR